MLKIILVLTFGQIVATMFTEHLFDKKEEKFMTEQEKEIIEIIRGCPDADYALSIAIEIFTSLAEQLLTSQ